MGLLLTCFIVGLIFFMLFSEDGRGCLGVFFAGIFGIIGITIVGGAILIFLVFLIANL